MKERIIHQFHRRFLCRRRNLEIVSLKLGPELSKDFGIVVDLCFDGDSEEALMKAVVMLVKEKKLLRETNRVDFMKVVDEVFDGDEDRAKREAIKLLLERCKAI